MGKFLHVDPTERDRNGVVQRSVGTQGLPIEGGRFTILRRVVVCE